MRVFVRVLLTLAVITSTARPQARLFGELHDHLPFSTDETRSVVLADVDGDGDLDIIVGNSAAQPNRLYLNDGPGTFVEASGALPAFAEATRTLTLGDVDADGDLDLVVGNDAGGPVRLHLNNGAGTFTDATSQLPFDVTPTSSIALGDVDGDGDLDLLLAKDYGAQDRLFLNDGTGTFSDATSQLPVDTDPTASAALADVDGDGDLDAVFGVGTFLGAIPVGQQTRLYLNDGTGTFTDASFQMPFDTDVTADVAVADLDADGDLDLVIANWLGQDRLYLNDGNGNFSDATAQLPPDNDYGRAVVAGDVDGDGDVDLLFGNGYQQDRLYLNDGFGTFSDGTAQLPPRPTDGTAALAFGDVDGDGDLDALIGREANRENRLFLNDGAGLFFDSRFQFPVVSDYTRSVVMGDVDGDGHLDAVVGEYSEVNRIYRNDGTGIFNEDVNALPPDDDSTHRVTLGDVDGDGDLDLLAASLSTFELNRLYLNDGTGSFSSTSGQLPVGGGTTELALGDLDGDGDPDIVRATWSQTSLYLNNGSGFFTDATSQLPTDGDTTNKIALGDVDGDGDLDIFLANSYQTAQNRLYLNNGSGLFVDGTAGLPTTLDFTYAVAFGDVNGDGNLDAVTGNVGQNGVLLGNGAGGFTDAATLLPPLLDQTRAVALGDVDGDGDLDIFFGNDGQDRLLLNDGLGSFTEATALIPADVAPTWDIALGDVDGDGDVDAMTAHPYGRQNRLWVNLTRQLAWRGLPRFGKALAIDVFGPPAESWLLYASSGAASIPLLPFGTLRINPIGAVFVASGSLDVTGLGSITIPILPNPGGLASFTIYGQAIVGTSTIRLTNLETFTFSNL